MITFYTLQPGIKGPFLLDDRANLSHLTLESLAWDELGKNFEGQTGAYPGARGLTMMTFALTRHFGGDTPTAYKYQNVLLHLVNGLLVFWLFLILFSTFPAQNSRLPPIWLSLLITSIWLLHPLHVSTVLYAVQRLVLLSSLFSLAALLVYAKARLLAQDSPTLAIILGLSGVALFTALGLVSKENAVLIPLYLLALEIFFFSRIGTSNNRSRLTVRLLTMSLIGLPLALGCYYVVSHWSSLTQGYIGREFDLYDRILTQTHVIGMYLQLIFIPIPKHMSLFHDNFPIIREVHPVTVALVFSYLSSVVLAFFFRRRAAWLGFAIAWFFISHLLESTFIPLELVFEHRNYLAVLGPAIVLGVAASYLLNVSSKRLSFGLVTFSLLALLAFNTYARANIWSNFDLLMQTELEENPTSVRILSGIVAHKSRQGKNDEALEYVRKIQQLPSPEAAPFIAELILRCDKGKPDDAVLRKARERLSAGIIGPFTGNMLFDLFRRRISAGCPSVSDPDFQTLLRTALQNQKHGPGMACAINSIYVQHNAYLSDWDKVAMRLPVALSECLNFRTHDSRVLLENIRTFAEANGTLPAANSAITNATTTLEANAPPKKLPDWVSAEPLR
ncbi:MAG: hypothetical protein K9M02_21240 [Thiohalocapsa sp.]|nr:hypothetical protein [Thiohalocapsa sp.]